jgi:hypothetical protein
MEPLIGAGRVEAGVSNSPTTPKRKGGKAQPTSPQVRLGLHAGRRVDAVHLDRPLPGGGPGRWPRWTCWASGRPSEGRPSPRALTNEILHRLRVAGEERVHIQPARARPTLGAKVAADRNPITLRQLIGKALGAAPAKRERRQPPGGAPDGGSSSAVKASSEATQRTRRSREPSAPWAGRSGAGHARALCARAGASPPSTGADTPWRCR